jgi:hypothetical protein
MEPATHHDQQCTYDLMATHWLSRERRLHRTRQYESKHERKPFAHSASILVNQDSQNLFRSSPLSEAASGVVVISLPRPAIS